MLCNCYQKKGPEIVEPDVFDLMTNMGESRNHRGFQAETEAQNEPLLPHNFTCRNQYRCDAKTDNQQIIYFIFQVVILLQYPKRYGSS